MALAVVAFVSLGAGPSRTPAGQGAPLRSGPAPEGLVLEQDTSHSFRSMVGMVTQEDRQRVYLSPGGVRVESVAEGQEPKFHTIFRFEPKGRVVRVEVDVSRRTYREEDLSERAAENEKLRESLRKRAEEARKKAAKEGPGGKEADAPEGAPALPLDLLAGGLGGADDWQEESAAPVEVKETKDVSTIAGRRTRRFEFLQGGEKVFEAWYTEKAAPEWVRRFDLDELPGAENAALMRARRERRGLELRSILYLPAGGRAEIVTTKIAEKVIAGSLLGPPAGFRKVAPPAPVPGGGADR